MVALPNTAPVPTPRPAFGSALNPVVQGPPSMLDYAPRRQAAPATSPLEALFGGLSRGISAMNGPAATVPGNSGDNAFQDVMRLVGAAFAPPEVTRAVNGIRQEREQRQEHQAELAEKNRTLAYLRKNYPQAASMVDAGLPVNDAFRLAMAQRQQEQTQAARQKFLAGLPSGMPDIAQPDTSQPRGNLLFPGSMTDNVATMPAQPSDNRTQQLLKMRALYADRLASAPDEASARAVKARIGQIDAMLGHTSDVRPMTAQERAQWGIPANDTRSFMMTDDGPKVIGGGGVTVNNNMGGGAPELGKLSTDYGYVLDPKTQKPVIDPQTGLPKSAPIPGSPAWQAERDAQSAGDQRQSAADVSTRVITNAANRALEAAKNRNFGPAGTTAIAGLPVVGPMTDSGEVVRQTDVLKSNATIENLNAMRRESKTGGALGNVTEKEGAMLAAKSGALDPNSPTFPRDLADYTKTLLEIVHGKEAGDRIFDETWDKPAGSAPAPGKTSTGVQWSIKR